VESSSLVPDSYAKVTFRIPHGCDGSATTQITVQIPEGVLSVKPQVHAGWTISTKKITLNPPVMSHGQNVSEAISEVSWKGGPLSDEYMDEFSMSLKLPDRPNARLIFPVIQDCEKGSSRWIEVATSEHAAHEGKFPAPALTLQSKSKNAHKH
jgi:uncharacterized protein YcnI